MGAERERRRGLGWAAVLAAPILWTLGCVSPSDPLAHREALEFAQKRYTEAIRWGDLERAARYVDPAMRENFLAWSDAFQDIRISDYEIGEVEMEDEEKLRAQVDVTFRGYALPYFVEQRIRDHQVWYRDEALGDDRWRVKPELEPLVAGLRSSR